MGRNVSSWFSILKSNWTISSYKLFNESLFKIRVFVYQKKKENYFLVSSIYTYVFTRVKISIKKKNISITSRGYFSWNFQTSNVRCWNWSVERSDGRWSFSDVCPNFSFSRIRPRSAPQRTEISGIWIWKKHRSFLPKIYTIRTLRVKKDSTFTFQYTFYHLIFLQ